MPMPALVALLVMFSGVFTSHAMAACSSNAGVPLASSVAAVVLALDDEAYSDRYDEDESAGPENRDFNYYGRDDEDDEGNSANAPDDDDDGWDIDPLNRSEWA